MQNHRKLKARILSLALSAAMVTTMLPATVFAVEGDGIALGTSSMGEIKSGEIKSFDKLGEPFVPGTGEGASPHVYGLTVELDTPYEDLQLPTELTAMVARTKTVTAPAQDNVSNGNEDVMDSGKPSEPAGDNVSNGAEDIPSEDEIIPDEDEVTDDNTDTDDTVSGNQPATPSDAEEKEEIKDDKVPLSPEPEQEDKIVTTMQSETIAVTWNSDKEYTSEKKGGPFIFTAEISEDYILADGVKLPQIYVYVGNQTRTSGLKTQRTSVLDFSNGGESSVDNLATEGWKWELNGGGYGGTLTLDGLNLSVSDGPALIITDNVTIVLTEGSVNNIVSTAAGSSAITSDDDKFTQSLTIEGKGTLNITGDYYGIHGYNRGKTIPALTIDGSTVNATCAKSMASDNSHNHAIVIEGTITLKNEAKVTATATGTEGKGVAVYAFDQIVLSDDETLLVANGGYGAIQCFNQSVGVGDMTGVVITGSETLGEKLKRARHGDGETNRQLLFVAPYTGDEYIAKTARLIFATEINALTIGTVAPVASTAIADGTNTPPTGINAPTVTWSADNGSNWSAASGNFAAGTAYQTKYVYTAQDGYVFNCDIVNTDITVTNAGSVSVERSDYDKTLTVTVTWPAFQWTWQSNPAPLYEEPW